MEETPARAAAGPTSDALWVDGLQGMVTPGCQALLDPGSTGGMLDALARGALGPNERLSADLEWALRVFRGDAVCR